MDTSKNDLLIPEWYEINPKIEENLKVLLESPVKKRQTPPLGYSWVEGEKECYPHPDILPKMIKALADTKYSDKRSLRESMDYINKMCIEEGLGVVNTAGGISNVFSRLEKQLGIHNGKTDSKDRIKAIRKARIDQRKKEGRKHPRYFSREDQKKIDAQKKLTATNLELKKLEAKGRKMKVQVARQAAKLKLKGDPTKFGVEEEQQQEVLIRKKKDQSPLSASYDITGVPDERPVAFAPNPGPQTDFLSADEDIVLYGGAAGG